MQVLSFLLISFNMLECRKVVVQIDPDCVIYRPTESYCTNCTVWMAVMFNCLGMNLALLQH